MKILLLRDNDRRHGKNSLNLYFSGKYEKCSFLMSGIYVEDFSHPDKRKDTCKDSLNITWKK